MKMEDKVKRYTKNHEDKKSFSEWGRCSAHGCPMMATVKTGSELCQFHHGHNMGQGGSTWNAITEAIKHHKGLIDKYTNLVHTPSSSWNIIAMKAWHVLPMEDSEPPTIYLNKFNKWIHEQINNTATELM